MLIILPDRNEKNGNELEKNGKEAKKNGKEVAAGESAKCNCSKFVSKQV